jgi:hypothetical protein
MATAKRKLVSVRDFMSNKKIKVECEACYNEEGSYACIRPSHDAYKATHGEEPVTQELLAGAILNISDSVKALFKTGLNKRAVIALIADDTKLGKGTISAVLNSIADLQKNYTTPKGTNSRGPM